MSKDEQDEHADIERLTMIFEKQGLMPEEAAEKAASKVVEKEDSLDDYMSQKTL